jgi:hypothetical protein
MTEQISLLQAAAHPGNTEGVTATGPTKYYRPEKCEFAIDIGLFFDGTRNNQDWAEPGLGGATQLARKKDSNVARLYRAYPYRPLDGRYPIYIPGVGTPFPEIGEEGPSKLGMGFGAGGDARIVFGLLHVLNAMHRSIDDYDMPMIEHRTVRALCRNGWLPMQTGNEGTFNRLSPADQWELDKVGMKDQGGLLTINGFSYRTTFLKRQFAQLAQKIKDLNHPKLVEVFIDVFGFSRGAAQARAFCNWLDECFEGDTVAGVKTHIRFLGIFDTVAAVGLGPAASRWANGHNDWGDTNNLRISPRVRHCEHYVAMHEQRESFPLEDIQMPGDTMPPRCRQFRFPGMHSDVGGGYLPEEQGKNGGDDEHKLARIPLEMMYQSARAARVPLKEKAMIARDDGWDPFSVSKQLQSDYSAFMQANGTGVRAITDCLIDILAWRFRHRDAYDTLPFVQSSPDDDKHDLLGAHQIFMKDIGEIREAVDQLANAKRHTHINPPRRSLGMRLFRRNASEQKRANALTAMPILPKDRRDILEHAIQRKLSDVELAFFSRYCHDSYAGFKPFDFAVVNAVLSRNAPWEDGGYLHYRTRYAGESLRLAMHELNTQEPATADIA